MQQFNPEWGLEAYAFVSTLQLVVAHPSDNSKIKTFGSGFFLKYRDHLFCVTADHIIHPDDHFDNDTGQRARIEYLPQIMTGINDKLEWRSKNIPLGGFYDHTEYVLDDSSAKDPEKLKDIFMKIAEGNININDESLPIGVAIPNFIDIAICKMTEPLTELIVNGEVRKDDNEVLVPANTLKVCLLSDSVAEFNKDDFYLVAGTVKNDIVNSMNLVGTYMLHIDMQFERFNTDGDAVLKVWEHPNIENWSGLSGAPVFNYKWELVGMLVAGPVTEPFARVVPIKTIIEYIDRCIAYESNQID